MTVSKITLMDKYKMRLHDCKCFYLSVQNILPSICFPEIVKIKIQKPIILPVVSYGYLGST